MRNRCDAPLFVILHILYNKFILYINPYFITYMSGVQIKKRIGRVIMKYIIYLDVFFMVNVVMDTLLLKLAALYIKPQTTFVRCVAGGTAGGVLSCISMLLPYGNILIHTLFSYVIIAFIMTIVTFGKGNLKQLWGRTASLYITTILLGGMMNLLYDYTYFGYIVQGIFGAIYVNPLNLLRLCMFTILSYIMLRFITKILQEKKFKTNLVLVRLQFKGHNVVLKGLIDSGNSLTDPYCGKPVHIVEYEALQRILEGVDIHREKYRVVPFHSLGRRNGLIEVIELDKLSVLTMNEQTDPNGQDTEQSSYEEEKPAIGLYHGFLSGENKYEVLLHSVVVGSLI